MSDKISVGAVIEIGYPFIRDTYTGYTEDGPVELGTWRPGTRAEFVAPDDREMVADAMGTQIVTVISTHKPGRFPERVFFTRRWRNPEGKEFGRVGLHTTTSQAFRRLIRGHRHEFRIINAVGIT